jgi:hypothetical protein
MSNLTVPSSPSVLNLLHVSSSFLSLVIHTLSLLSTSSKENFTLALPSSSNSLPSIDFVSPLTFTL